MEACDGSNDAATAYAAHRDKPLPCVFLVDASRMCASLASAYSSQPWSPSHHFSTSERLLQCYKQVRDKRPDALISTFLDNTGYSSLCSEWSVGGAQAADISTLHCVPFGGKVSVFVVEFAEKKVAEGYEVAVVSNTVDVVKASLRTQPVAWRHLSFMFIDGELILPGLSRGLVASAPPSAHAAIGTTASHPVRRTISKAKSGSSCSQGNVSSSTGQQLLRRGSRSSQKRSSGSQQRPSLDSTRNSQGKEERLAEVSDEGDQDTLQDDDLDGVALDMDMVDALKDGEEFADTFVEARSLSLRGGSLGGMEAFADTLVEERASLQQGASRGGEAFADTLVDAHAASSRAPSLGTDAGAYADTLVVDDRLPSLSSNADFYADTQVDAEMGVPCSVAQARQEERDGKQQAVVNDAQAASTCGSQGQPASTVTLEADQPKAPKEHGEGDPDVVMVLADHVGSAGRTDAAEAARTMEVKREPSSQPSADTDEQEAARPRPKRLTKGAGEPTGDVPAAAEQASLPNPTASVEEAVKETTSAEDNVQPSADTDEQEAKRPRRKKVETGAGEPTGDVPAAAEQASLPNPTASAEEVVKETTTAEHNLQAPLALAEAVASVEHQATDQSSCNSQVDAGARKFNFTADILLGSWIRDLGRTHEVVRLPAAAGDDVEPAAQLEFRPADGERSKNTAILRFGDTWMLNGFVLNVMRSSPQLLRWEKQPGGLVRSWWRPSPPN